MTNYKKLEEQLSEVLDNILGLLLLEGSYEIEEGDEAFSVSIDTKDAGRLIGARGESLEGLQLLINQIISKKAGEENFKRVILDVSGWRKQKEEELVTHSKEWGNQVLETGKDLELEPQSAWQRRVVHMVVGEMDGLETESIGEGRDRHVVIKVKLPSGGPKEKGKTEDKQSLRSKDLKNKDAEDKED